MRVDTSGGSLAVKLPPDKEEETGKAQGKKVEGGSLSLSRLLARSCSLFLFRAEETSGCL